MFKIIIGILVLFGILVWRSEYKRKKIQTDADKRLDAEQVAQESLKTEAKASSLHAKNVKLSDNIIEQNKKG